MLKQKYAADKWWLRMDWENFKQGTDVDEEASVREQYDLVC